MENKNHFSPTTNEITNGFVNPQSITFSSNLATLNPEVAKKVLEHTPDLAQTAKEVLVNSKEVTERGFESNDMSMKYFYENAEKNSVTIRKCIEEKDMSEESIVKLADMLNSISQTMAMKDTENKGFVDKQILKYMAFSFGVSALVGGFLGAGVAIGLNIPPIRFK